MPTSRSWLEATAGRGQSRQKNARTCNERDVDTDHGLQGMTPLPEYDTLAEVYTTPQG